MQSLQRPEKNADFLSTSVSGPLQDRGMMMGGRAFTRGLCLSDGFASSDCVSGCIWGFFFCPSHTPSTGPATAPVRMRAHCSRRGSISRVCSRVCPSLECNTRKTHIRWSQQQHRCVRKRSTKQDSLHGLEPLVLFQTYTSWGAFAPPPPRSGLNGLMRRPMNAYHFLQLQPISCNCLLLSSRNFSSPLGVFCLALGRTKCSVPNKTLGFNSLSGQRTPRSF